MWSRRRIITFYALAVVVAAQCSSDLCFSNISLPAPHVASLANCSFH